MVERKTLNLVVVGSSPTGGGKKCHSIFSMHMIEKTFCENIWNFSGGFVTKNASPVGFEPTIPWFVVRCLIRWATGTNANAVLGQ